MSYLYIKHYIYQILYKKFKIVLAFKEIVFVMFVGKENSLTDGYIIRQTRVSIKNEI